MRTHAANPTAELLGGRRVRVYFSSRDDANRSSIAFVELDVDKPSKVLRESDQPVLSPGAKGKFDDSGASIGCIVPVDGKRYLYYMGWHLTVDVPWQNAIGLAISDSADGPFTKTSSEPIIALDDLDPHTISYPWVRREGDRFRMWYGSNVAWGSRKEDMRHVIKYAESSDGIRWKRENVVAIDFDSADEYAICRPAVMKDGPLYRMWFCARGAAYRIKYAESRDAKTWSRKDDDAGIDVSPSGWDSEMIEYPNVFDLDGQRYMLYAGNAFGKTGFGLAALESD